MALVRSGSDRAFEQLYERYRPRILAYVQGMVRDHGRAEDLTQEVFMSALRRMRETERPIAVRAWLYEIARNACIDQFRRSRRVEELPFHPGDGNGGGPDELRLVSSQPEPEVAVDAKDQLTRLCSAFAGLSDSHHQILVMRELEGLSYRQIAERMDLSRTAVESTLFRARRRLAEEYDDLATGRRCTKVQGIIAAAAEGMSGVADRRRMARHLSYCQPCRRHARALGVAPVRPRVREVAGRLAALLPFPFAGRKGPSASADQPAPRRARGLLGQWSSSAAPASEPLGGTAAKAAVVIAAIALAGGTEVASRAVTKSSPGGAAAVHRSASHPAQAPAASAPLVAPSPFYPPQRPLEGSPLSGHAVAAPSAERLGGPPSPARRAASPSGRRSTGEAVIAPGVPALGPPTAGPSIGSRRPGGLTLGVAPPLLLGALEKIGVRIPSVTPPATSAPSSSQTGSAGDGAPEASQPAIVPELPEVPTATVPAVPRVTLPTSVSGGDRGGHRGRHRADRGSQANRQDGRRPARTRQRSAPPGQGKAKR